MMHNPNIVEQIANNRLAELRAEGMRSQMLAQAGLTGHRKLDFSGFTRFFHQIAAFVAGFGLKRIAHPRTHKTLTQNDCM